MRDSSSNCAANLKLTKVSVGTIVVLGHMHHSEVQRTSGVNRCEQYLFCGVQCQEHRMPERGPDESVSPQIDQARDVLHPADQAH